MDIAERRLPQDGRMNLHAANQENRRPRFNHSDGERRVHQFAFARSWRTTVRFSASRSQPGTGDRNPPSLAQPNGIILLTGPTGCGKSTSLYCFLSTINQVSRRIITIEEPVEYKLPGVLQMDVKPEIDFTFARGFTSHFAAGSERRDGR
jgi:type II secretory ATPase GspE/PulE/Tfp pilus assembly ATPase PilB-like protein